VKIENGENGRRERKEKMGKVKTKRGQIVVGKRIKGREDGKPRPHCGF